MTRVLGGLVAVVTLGVLWLLPAQADESTHSISCVLDHVTNSTAVINCTDSTTGDILPVEDVPLPTVTLPPLPPVTKLVRAPRATTTATVTLPGRSKTITAAPSTIFISKTVRGPVRLRDGQTVFITTTLTPDLTQPTKTVTVHGGGKPHTVTVTHKVAVGLGFIAILALVGLILLGLWLGYILGYKDSDRTERRFLEALRDQFYTSGKHQI